MRYGCTCPHTSPLAMWWLDKTSGKLDCVYKTQNILFLPGTLEKLEKIAIHMTSQGKENCSRDLRRDVCIGNMRALTLYIIIISACQDK